MDADDRHHFAMRSIYAADPSAWILPWAILPEVDYLLGEHVDTRAQHTFQKDVASGALSVEWGQEADLRRAVEIIERYASIDLGLVDAVVAAVAERVRATAIATVDLRDFGPLELAGSPRLYPRDHIAKARKG